MRAFQRIPRGDNVSIEYQTRKQCNCRCNMVRYRKQVGVSGQRVEIYWLTVVGFVLQARTLVNSVSTWFVPLG